MFNAAKTTHARTHARIHTHKSVDPNSKKLKGWNKSDEIEWKNGDENMLRFYDRFIWNPQLFQSKLKVQVIAYDLLKIMNKTFLFWYRRTLWFETDAWIQRALNHTHKCVFVKKISRIIYCFNLYRPFMCVCLCFFVALTHRFHQHLDDAVLQYFFVLV